MVAQVAIQQQGNAVGIELPQDVRTWMGLEVGQQLTLIELHDGLKLVRRSAALERQLDVARKPLKEQADVLQALAEPDRQPSLGNADP